VNGFWAQKGGCEVPFCYGALAAIVAFTGPGRWSLDAALEPAGPSGYAWGIGAVVVGLLAAGVPLTARARVLRARRTTTR
jgi:putative oxidoreductase